MLAWLRRRWMWVGAALVGLTMIGGLAWWFGERAWWGWVDDQPLSAEEVTEIAACSPIGWTTGLKVLEQDLAVSCPSTWFAEVMAPHLRIVGGTRSIWLRARLGESYPVRAWWRAGSTLMLAGASPEAELAIWSRLAEDGDRSALADRMRDGLWPRGWEDPDLSAEVDLRGADGAWVIGPESASYLRRRSVLAADRDVATWVALAGDGLGVSAGLTQPELLPGFLRQELDRVHRPCPSRACLRLLAAWAERDDHPDLGVDDGAPGVTLSASWPLATVLSEGDRHAPRAHAEVVAAWGEWISAAPAEDRPTRWAALIAGVGSRGGGDARWAGRPELTLEQHRGALYTTGFASVLVGRAAGLEVTARSAGDGLALRIGETAIYLNNCGGRVMLDPEVAPPPEGDPWPEGALQALAAREAAESEATPERATVLRAWAATLDPEAAGPQPAPFLTSILLPLPLALPRDALDDRERAWKGELPQCR